MSTDGTRREEILQTAASMFASSGLRTSVQDIAEACGILPGSLYHHFVSKEAIIIELVERYLQELDQVAAEAVDDLHGTGERSFENRVIDLGEAIARCATRHRAALILTLYEPPSASSEELASLARRTPTTIVDAMLEILRAARSAGAIRSGIDLPLLAQRLCQSMLHVGVGVFHRSPRAASIPALKCRIVLHGVAVRVPSKRALDRSGAMRAAREVVATWSDGDEGEDPSVHLRAVARSEFARRGYETTTIRDVAATAGVSTGTVYRLFGSKDDLLASIMNAYKEKGTSIWDAIVRSESSPLEKLDALTWAYIVIFDRFSEEFRIHLAWLRRSPPTSANLDGMFRKELRHIKAILAAGTRTGEIRLQGGAGDVPSRAIMELIHMPESIVHAAGVAVSHELARDTLLRGATPRQ